MQWGPKNALSHHHTRPGFLGMTFLFLASLCATKALFNPSVGALIYPIRAYRHPPAQLALSPAEQYAAQQAEMRARRQRRIEEEAAKASEVVDDRAEAELRAFQMCYAEPLAIFEKSLYPAQEYSDRNGISRKDGYWSFVHRNEEPNPDFTYGEFPLPFFHRLIDRACELHGCGDDRRSCSLIDLGSGAGRLALWAAATSAWRRVVGVEYLRSLASTAVEKLEEARAAGLLRTDEVVLTQGTWDEKLDCFAEVDVAFAYTTAITTNDEGILEGLSRALAQRLRRGCIVVTTDYKLDPAHFEVLDTMTGENSGVGGTSTGYLHRKRSRGERDAAGEADGKADGSVKDDASCERARAVNEDDASFAAMEAAFTQDLHASFAAMEAALSQDLHASFGSRPDLGNKGIAGPSLVAPPASPVPPVPVATSEDAAKAAKAAWLSKLGTPRWGPGAVER